MRKLAFVLTILVAIAAAARADVVRPPEYVSIGEADLIVVGRVLEVDRRHGRLQIDSVLKLKGRLETQEIVFSPTIEPQCVVSDDTPTFCAEGEWIVLMLTRDGERWMVCGHGFGHESLTNERLKSTVEGVRELVPTLAAEPERRRARMVRFLSSSNDYLRHVATWFVRHEMQNKPEIAAPHADALVAALDSGDAWVRMSAMYALQHVGDARAVPKLIAATKVHAHFEDAAAWDALGTYDTDEVFAFVVAEARRPDGGLWPIRAVSESPRPAAEGVLRELLATAQGERFAAVVQAFANRFRRGRGDAAVARDLARLIATGDPRLDKSMPEEALVWAGTPQLLDDLVALLADPKLSLRQERAVLHLAYFSVYEGKRPAHLEVLRNREKLFTDLLDRGAGRSRYSTWIVRVIGGPSARACLKRTAKSHPDADTRREAQEQLDRGD